MPNYTSNLRLIKPLENEFYDINEHNSNMDIIDKVVSNPNLLDNPWFTINQRGQSVYTTDGYCYDRWALDSASVGSGGSVGGITLLARGDGYCGIRQKLDSLSNFIGAEMTFSVLDSSHHVHSMTFTCPNNGDPRVDRTFTLTNGVTWRFSIQANNGIWDLQIKNNTKNSSVFIAMKLELGSVSTLENDSAPNYAEELLKCQRYYQEIDSSLFNYYFYDLNQIWFIAPLSEQMRTSPSAIAKGTPNIRTGGSVQSGFTTTFSGNSVVSCIAKAVKNSHAISNPALCNIHNAVIALSADL
ncbi:MAG: hypothetical protein KBS66_07445 [Eubacterium sp.]|nr:hypothetical protein [Candidatus Colimonas fimequi]